MNFILLSHGDSKFEDFLIQNKIPFNRIHLYSGWKLILSFISVWFTLFKIRPDIIHTHLRYASLLGIIAGYLTGVKNRIHTRHHAASNHYYYPHAVKHDKWVSRLSTYIVSISDVVSEVLIEWENTPTSKVVKIPHGFDLDLFRYSNEIKINSLRNKYIPRVKGPVIGMISRYMTLKGINYAIQAFKTVLLSYPDAHLILANANGPQASEIKIQLQELPKNTYTEITFESDIASLYQLFDIFVHIPISEYSEAFGQTYVEALASGIPSIFTLSGIAKEFIVHEKNALVVPFKDDIAIAIAIDRLLRDKVLRQSIIENGKASMKEFELDLFINRLESLYNV